jgi:cytochrome c
VKTASAVFLEIPELKAGNVVYLRLLPPCLSEDGEKLWSTEAWVHTQHASERACRNDARAPALPPQNVLTAAEKAEGWRLLFDGKTVEGWHPFKKVGGRPEGLVNRGRQPWCDRSGSDIVSDDTFEEFRI